MVEHGTENAGVDSSTLSLGTSADLSLGASADSGPRRCERKWLSGRASPCQGEGRGFKSRLPLHAPQAARPLRRGERPAAAESPADALPAAVDIAFPAGR